MVVDGRRGPTAAAADTATTTTTAAVGSNGSVQLGRERVDRRISIGAVLFRTVGQFVRRERLPPSAPPAAAAAVTPVLLLLFCQEFLDSRIVPDQYGSQVRHKLYQKDDTPKVPTIQTPLSLIKPPPPYMS